MLRAFLSVPHDLSWDSVRFFIDSYSKLFDIVYHRRGTVYDDLSLATSDIFVLFTQQNLFRGGIQNLPKGVQAELRRAINTNKELVLVYSKLGFRSTTYKLIVKGEMFEGVQGTSDYLYSLRNNQPAVKTKEPVRKNNIVLLLGAQNN